MPPTQVTSSRRIRPQAETQAPRDVGDLADREVRHDDAEPANDKVCRHCGKDLRGHRRFKDSLGYLCKDCDAEDKARRIPCAECGTPTLPHALQPFGNVSICTSCKADHDNDPQKKFRRRISTEAHDKHAMRSVYIIGAVVLVLLLILLFAWL